MSASKGPDWYNESDIDKMHMLAACVEGSIETVQEFLDKGVQVDEFDDDRVTALQIAAARGHTKLAEYLLTFDPDLERCNVVGFTPLLHACREGNLDVVKLLIQRGAKLDVTTFTGASPLTLACAGGHFELVKYLLLFKDVVDINPKKHDVAPSPLMAAAFKNQSIIASCLVSRGARVDYVMPQFSLDIMSCVVMCSSATMFSTLLDLGAKPEAIRNYKNTNIDDLVNICGRVDIWRVLQDHKRQLQRQYSSTVDIRKFIQEGRVVETIDLLDHPEKWTSLEDGQTPLMFAVIFGQVEIVRAIIENLKNNSSSDLDAQESKLGLTALMIAVILKDNEMVINLLHAGAKVFIKCSKKWTALDFAYAAGIDAKVIGLLHKKLANLPLMTKKIELAPISSSIPRSGKLAIFGFKFLQKFGITESETIIEYPPRDEFLSGIEVGNIDFSHISDRFRTAENILRGSGSKSINCSTPSFDDYMVMIWNQAEMWVRNGFLLKPLAIGIPFNGDFDNLIGNMKWEIIGENNEFDGNYSAAEKRCAQMTNPKPNSKSSSNSFSSIYSDSNASYLKKSGTSSQKFSKKPSQLSYSANVVGHSNYQPPSSPSAHSLVENRKGSYLLNPVSYSHLRSSSYQAILPKDSIQSEKYQYLKETASPRISPQRLHKITDTNGDILYQRLKSIGLQNYFKTFKDQEVDFQTFLRCDQNDVRQIIQSSENYDESDVFAIMKLISELKQVYFSPKNMPSER